MESHTQFKATGLPLLAARKPERWLSSSGKPLIARIARDAEIDRTQIHRVRNGTSRPGLKFQQALRNLAMSTGMSREQAHELLFEDIDAEVAA